MTPPFLLETTMLSGRVTVASVQGDKLVDVSPAHDAIHDQFMPVPVGEAGLTVHRITELGRGDGVCIDEVTGQDDAVFKVDDDPVAVMGLLVEGVERKRDVPALCARVVSGDDSVVQAADKFAGHEVVAEQGVGFIPGIAHLKGQVEGVRFVAAGVNCRQTVNAEMERYVAGLRK